MKREGLGRSRGGFTTKIHIVCDGAGLPLGAALSPGQAHDGTCFETAMGAVVVDGLPSALAGDKAYGARQIRAWLDDRSVQGVIPYKSNQQPPEEFELDCDAYRRRNVIERLIGWLKECRRVATRFEKLGRHFLAMVKLAALRRLLKVAV